MARRQARRGGRARARRAGAQDQPARHRGDGARAPRAPTATPASPRCASSPAARRSRPGSPPWAGCWTSFAPCDSMAVGRSPRSTTMPEEPRHGPELFARRAGLPRRGARLAAAATCRTSCAPRWKATRSSRRTISCAGTRSWPRRAGSRRTGRRSGAAPTGTWCQRYIFEEECGFAATPPLIPFGLRMCAPVLLQLRHRRPEEALPAPHLPGRGLLVPGLLGAGLGLGPGLAQDARGARRATTTWSPARRSGPRSPTTPTGSSAWCAPTPPDKRQDGISFLLIDMKTPGITRAADRLDGRRPRGQRGVLRRRQGARREPRARGGQGLDGGQVPARLRAHGHRPHRRLQARAGASSRSWPAQQTQGRQARSSRTRASATGSRAWRSS